MKSICCKLKTQTSLQCRLLSSDAIKLSFVMKYSNNQGDTLARVLMLGQQEGMYEKF